MKDFYSIEENFNFLYNNISRLLTESIVEPALSENWLANWYVCNRYNTTRAIEKHAADLIIPKLQEAEIPVDVFKSIIDKKLNGCFETYNEIEYTLEDKLYLVNNIKCMNINESTLSYIIQDFECDDIVEYIGENYNNTVVNQFNSDNDDTRRVMNILTQINQKVIDNLDDRVKLEAVMNYNTAILYKHKYTSESFEGEIISIYETLDKLLETQSDEVIEHSLKELDNINKLIEHVIKHNLDESAEEFIYEHAVEKFDYLVEDIFFNTEEIQLERLMELYTLTEALCEYESTMEASSRIITKGTEKVTKAIGNASAKGRGMADAKSKVDQIKRGAKVVDDRASSAINSKIDQIINFNQEAKREKLITGKTSVQLGKNLKTIIGMIVAGFAVSKLPKQTILKLPFFTVKAPLLGLATTIIGLLGARALSKRTEEREKKRILLELETELKITREKIEDAKGDNAKEQKYQLMRIEANLEKEIMRIKHGMRYY